jgi:excisionase family DNA binding protein
MQIVHFSPPELARMLSVNESTVKRWIDRGLLHATRTPGGHRRVHIDDLQKFLATQKKARKHSYTLARYAKDVEHEGWQRYYDLHFDYKAREAQSYLVGAMITYGNVRTVLEQIVIPSLVNIGAQWREGNLDIADEHRMTFLIRADLHALESMLPAPKSDAPCALLACVPEENHELALQMVSLIARTNGWRTTILGINVPASEVLRVSKEHDIDMVMLAKQYDSGSKAAYVREVRKHLKKDVPLVLGGAGWSASEQKRLSTLKGLNVVHNFDELQATLA